MDPSDGELARRLFPTAAADEQELVRRFAREAPLVYGYWRHVKGLYKDAEPASQPEVLGSLIARFDAVPLHAPTGGSPLDWIEVWGVTGMAVAGQRLFISTQAGLRIVDVSNPGAPALLCSENLGMVHAVALFGDLAYLLLTRRRMLILDVSDPTRPQDVGELRIPQAASLEISGGYLYLVETATRLRVFDLSEPRQPKEVGGVDLPDAGGVVVSGDRAYVCTRDGFHMRAGLYVVDITTPAQPALLGQVRTNAGGLLIAGRYLRTTRRDQRLWIADAGAPATPAGDARKGLLGWIHRLSSGGSAGATDLLGVPHTETSVVGTPHAAVTHRGFAYVGAPYGSLSVLALDHPDGPQKVGELPVSSAQAMVIRGDLLYVSDYRNLHVFDITNPAQPARLGQRPSARTFAYMKRRARRVLRKLSRQDPARFVEAAFHALREPGLGRETLDPALHWVTVDLLYGSGGRYFQQRHGRGAYVLRQPGLRRRTREERCPEGWDRRLDLAEALYTDRALPWQTSETMLKILRANAATVPAVSKESRLRFLRSPSPLLIRQAARESLADVERDRRSEPETAALVFFFSGAAVRKRLAATLAGRSGSPGWARPFTAALTGLVVQRISEGPGSGRLESAAELLTGPFALFVPSDQLLPVIERLCNAGRPSLARLGLLGFRNAAPSDLPQWLWAWIHLPDTAREPAWEMLVAGVRRGGFPAPAALLLVNHSSEEVRETAWRLLLAAPPDVSILRAIWEGVLATEVETPALRTAVRSAAALALLRQSGLELDALSDRVAALPSLVDLLSPEALETLVGAMPPEGVFRLIEAMSDARWLSLREAVVRGLERSGRLALFWKTLPDALAGGLLAARVMDDPWFADTFFRIDDPSFVELNDPRFEASLVRWVTEHAELFPRGSAGLLAAATHPLPQVRAWGLARVGKVGMDVAFALRLLESAVPPAMDAGRAFFTAVPPRAPETLEHALALSDSPDRATRAYGREYIEARRDSLPLDELVLRLSEHSDPEMHRFLAEILCRAPGLGAAVREFDRGVLRARNRGRKAKEQVKARLDRTGAPDTAFLLDLARSGTPRDAEWALGQLARLAADGQPVEGVTLEGVVGV